MAEEPESWINKPAFHWTPESPLRGEPKLTQAEMVLAGKAAPPPIYDPFPAAPSQSQAQAFNSSLWPDRLLTGLAQGSGLSVLLAFKPEIDPTLFSATWMALLFAPPAFLFGLGQLPFRKLLHWTIFISLLSAVAGVYHHWRTLSSDDPSLTLLVLAGLLLFAGQALLQSTPEDYSSHYRSAWRLAIRIAVCALFAGPAWAAAAFLHAYDPPLALVAMPLAGLVMGLAAHLTHEKLLGVLQEGLVFVLAMALLPLVLIGVGVTVLAAKGTWQPSLGVCAALGLGLILAINASYRDGTDWRPYWQRRAEFAASLVLLPLLFLAASALAARVAQYGWTEMRILALAGLMLMAGHGLAYAGAALISLGGGRWMQRIEVSNLALGFAGLALIVALASPIADPARLAVASQLYRLEQHKVSAARFDFRWLRRDGMRFGRDALEK